MKAGRTLFLLVLLNLLALIPARSFASPAVIRVTTGGASSGSCGDTWVDPCALQYALTTMASPGSELWVAMGIYTPTAGTDRTTAFQLRNGVALYGGFLGSEAARSQRTLTADATVLSGDIGISGDQADNSYHVVNGNGTDKTALLDGFTIRDGKADGNTPDNYGGGIYVGEATPTLANLIVVSNSASKGGGLYLFGSSLTLTNVTFISNSADAGAGLYSDCGGPLLVNVEFISNSAVLSGGGLYSSYGHSTLTNAVFNLNHASYGGGMYTFASSPTISSTSFISNSATSSGGALHINGNTTELGNVAKMTNVTFAGNTADSGGGIYNQYHALLMLTNTTFGGNIATGLGGALYNTNASNTKFYNSIAWGNTGYHGSQVFNTSSSSIDIQTSIIGGTCPSGSSCGIRSDPLLGSLNYYGGATPTFPLLPGSPAIDAGNDAVCAVDDQRGIARPEGIRCDIGAYESRGYAIAKTGGDNQSSMITTAFALPLSVSVIGAAGEPVNGGKLDYSSPAIGASTIPLTGTLAIENDAASISLAANGIIGSYSVSVNGSGIELPAVFSLTNTPYALSLPLVRR